jgi:hypothetical protein
MLLATDSVPGSATASSSTDDAMFTDPPLRWPCLFGCNATRVYEGGMPLLFTHLETCPKCGARIAVTHDEKAFAEIVARGLI